MKIIQSTTIGSANIVDGSILNVDINAAAAILASKTVLTAIAQIITPVTDNDYSLGTPTRRFTQISVNAIEGGARDFILLAGLMGV